MKQIITIPKFVSNKRNRLLNKQTELLYDLLDNQKKLTREGITDNIIVGNIKELCELTEKMVFDDVEKNRKEHTDLISKLVGKYWKVTYTDDSKLHSYIFPYEISNGRISMLYCSVSECNSGYSMTIRTEHDDMIDGIWCHDLTFTEITSEEFAKVNHDSVDDVLSYRQWKLKQPKPTFNISWKQ